MPGECLIIFVKNPVQGRVKTRLAKTIGSDNALAIYRELVNHTLKVTKSLHVEKVVYYSDYILNNDLFNTGNYLREIQDKGSLGTKMERAFLDQFNAGFNSICIIGSDNLEITTEIIEQAFYHLNSHDSVLGPAHDGGYYLLGLNRPEPKLFRGINWSSGLVLTQTIERIADLGLTCFTLPMLHDVDTIEDVKRYPELKKFIPR